MNTETNTAATGMGDALGACLTEYLSSILVDGKLALDPFDARDIDALIEEIRAALAAQPAPAIVGDVPAMVESWLAVCELLHEVAPDWGFSTDTGKEAALAAIRKLAAQPAPGVGGLLLERANEVVHHDADCPSVNGYGDKDCNCDAVSFLRDLEAALSTRPAESVAQGGKVAVADVAISQGNFGQEDGSTIVGWRVSAETVAAMGMSSMCMPKEIGEDLERLRAIASWWETGAAERREKLKTALMQVNDHAARNHLWDEILPLVYTIATPTPATGSGGEAVAEAVVHRGMVHLVYRKEWLMQEGHQPLAHGTKLYTHPAPAGGDAGDSDHG